VAYAARPVGSISPKWCVNDTNARRGLADSEAKQFDLVPESICC
jgi:hypothetical protein